MGWHIADNVYTFSADLDAAAPVEKVYPIVLDVERYPDFLPDIAAVRLHGDEMTMVYKAGPLDISVTSVFEFEPNTFIRFRLKKGPLKSLTGEWLFTSHGDGTRMTMRTSFEPKLQSRWLLRMTEKMLEYKTTNLLKRFRERFEALSE